MTRMSRRWMRRRLTVCRCVNSRTASSPFSMCWLMRLVMVMGVVRMGAAAVWRDGIR